MQPFADAVVGCFTILADDLIPVIRELLLLAQSVGLKIGAIDDKVEFQKFEPTALKPTLLAAD